MKKLLLSVAVLATVSTSANAWTDRWGHWHEAPGGYLYGAPVPPPYYALPYGYGAPIYGSPVVVAPPPTDAQVIAGTILGIAGMLARGRY